MNETREDIFPPIEPEYSGSRAVRGQEGPWGRNFGGGNSMERL